MPLTYDFTRIDDFQALHETEWERIVTDVFIWLSMPLEIGEITEENAGLVHFGIGLLDHLDGPFLNKDGKPYQITEQDVRRRIGLRTNTGSGSVAAIRKNIRRIVNDHMGRVK